MATGREMGLCQAASTWVESYVQPVATSLNLRLEQWAVYDERTGHDLRLEKSGDSWVVPSARTPTDWWGLLGKSRFEVLSRVEGVPPSSLFSGKPSSETSRTYNQYVARGVYDPEMPNRLNGEANSSGLRPFGLDRSCEFYVCNLRLASSSAFGIQSSDYYFVLVPQEPEVIVAVSSMLCSRNTTEIVTIGALVSSTQRLLSPDVDFLVTCDQRLHNLLKDVEWFVRPTTRSYYEDRGLSYKRGYLFTGPPGTGKTSTARLLAARFDLSVLVFLLSERKLSAEKIREHLGTQLAIAKGGLLVLFDDFDCVCAGDRTVENANLTFNEVLNLLDGVDSSYDKPVIFVISANFAQNFDKALVRPGRVDYKVRFDNLPPRAFGKMFRKFAAPNGTPELEELFLANLVKVGQKKICPAALEGFFLSQAQNPVDAWPDAVLAYPLYVEDTTYENGEKLVS